MILKSCDELVCGSGLGELQAIVHRCRNLYISSYSSGKKLAGVIYLRDISSSRMDAFAVSNLDLLSSLGGRGAENHLLLATSKWN